MRKLERCLGLSSVIAISISAMLGSGIFVLPGIAINFSGPLLWLAYLLAAICILPAAMSKSELATAMPTSGGTYIYLERTFGPLAGTVSGFGLFFSILLKSSFALVGFGTYLQTMTNVPLQMTSLILLVAILFLNIMGTGKVGQILIVVVTISVSSLLILIGMSDFPTEATLFPPIETDTAAGLLEATGIVFVAFAGVTKVAAIAEEIKSPEKNLPRGILYSLLIVTVLYCAMSLALIGNLSTAELLGNLRPVYDLALRIGGTLMGTALAIVAILTMASESNAGILAASRFPFAMARDRLLPSRLGRLHHKFLTPLWSIIFSGIVVAFAIIFLPLVEIVKLASAFMIMIYLVENIAVIVLREMRVQWYKPSFHAPFYPYIQIFGIVSGAVLLVYMGILSIIAILVIAVPGLLIYLLYGRSRTTRRGVIGIRGKRLDLVEDPRIKQSAPTITHLEPMDFSVEANVVVTLFGKERSPEMLIEMGVALAEHGNLEVAYITEVPEQTELDDVIEEAPHLKSLRRRIIAMAVDKKEPITFDPVITHDISKTIVLIGQRLHCQWFLIEWGGRSKGRFTINDPLGQLSHHMNCNLAIFRDAGVRYIRKIMVFINQDENDQLVLDTADHLADVNKADLTICQYVPLNLGEQAVQKSTDLLGKILPKCKPDTVIQTLSGKRKAKTVIAATVEFDLLILGSSQKSAWNLIFGAFEDQLFAKAACSVICVKKCGGSV